MKFFKSYSEKAVIKIEKKYVRKINKLSVKMKELSDEELKNKTTEFKERYKNSEPLDKMLVEVFAVGREASCRVLGLEHYDAQLIGGIVLYQGRIAEMKTGEGKTLVSTLPAYLKAISGEKVHIATVNDYLAKRDLDILKPLYDFLGVSTAYIGNDTPLELRKELYSNDVVYTTNSELGFDYLRNNSKYDEEEKTLGELGFIVLDEVDSILIDEARTPLIISKTDDHSVPEIIGIADCFVSSLSKKEVDIDLERKTVLLKEETVTKLEKIFGIENYSDIKNSQIRLHIDQSLHAYFMKEKDKDYMVVDGEVVIVDENTGRIAKGRRYNGFLHQALEAKEGVKINPETKTVATITYQNFFRMYKTLSGMTGTAMTEEDEFREIYSLDVVAIPTNKPIKRIDHPDKLYITETAKIKGIMQDISRCYKAGRPVLVGTPSIEKSEVISNILRKINVPHLVLNAKNHSEEAQIISKAGQKGSITIATNMAGRGTDIILGDGIEELGGLKVIAMERAENRRIDNQLIGRSGRQGNKGSSQFYLSLEDSLIAAYANDKTKELIGKMSPDDETPINNKFMSNIITNCQKKIEGAYFQARKTTIAYDDVINKQRTIIYKQRDSILKSIDIEHDLLGIIEIHLKALLSQDIKDEDDKISEEMLLKALEPNLFAKGTIDATLLATLYEEDLEEFLLDTAKEVIGSKIKLLGEDNFKSITKNIILNTVDEYWREHIDSSVELKKAVSTESYSQKNPLDKYIIENGKMFDSLIYHIQKDISSKILKMNIKIGTPIE